MAPVTTPQFEPPPLPLPVAASHGDIASSVSGPTPCMTCGYDLAGLLADGICPECATPVAKTLATPRFAKAPTDYLITLKRWLDFELYFIIFATALTPLCAFGFYAASINGTKLPIGLTLFTPAIIITATSFAGLLLWFLITDLSAWPAIAVAAPTVRRFVRGLGFVELLMLIMFAMLKLAAARFPEVLEDFDVNAILLLPLGLRFARFIASTILLAKLKAQETAGKAEHPLRFFAFSTIPLVIFPPLGLLAVTIWHYIFLISLRRSIAATLAKR